MLQKLWFDVELMSLASQSSSIAGCDAELLFSHGLRMFDWHGAAEVYTNALSQLHGCRDRGFVFGILNV
jgi:hypothetical protein